ncbi:unnamed protein product [Albugo candida]|uniref:THUMP domain-containing protein n=1 Tax=Albugo candida TaxID=65357 RepID=A0A024G240_9STRA|nr:unnamed protein product [Albugo candida]|eukprot:CCI40878.1 unnamed protein product [Albugo candida]
MSKDANDVRVKRKKQWKTGAVDAKNRNTSYNANASAAKGSQGVLLTCDRSKEKQTIRDALNLLNEAADRYFGSKESTECTSTASPLSSVQATLDAEVQELRSNAKKRVTGRFTPLDTGVKGVILLKCVHTTVSVEALIIRFFEELEESKEIPSRFINRLIPLEKIGHASINEIQQTAKELIQKRGYHKSASPIEYCVEVKRRNCTHIKSMDVINACVSEMDPLHKVNLTKPSVVIMIEIFRTTFGMSVVTTYHQHKRYNVRSIIDPPDVPKP